MFSPEKAALPLLLGELVKSSQQLWGLTLYPLVSYLCCEFTTSWFPSSTWWKACVSGGVVSTVGGSRC
jgi:hypothetical protein